MDFSGLSADEKAALMKGDFDSVPDEKLMALVNPPPSLGHQAADLAVGGLEHVGKGLDYLGGAVRTGVANLAGVSKPGETLDALNPLSKNTAPSSSEIMKRLGVPDGAKLSDYLGAIYADPANKGNAFWRPVKGGMLDPSVRGTIGTGLDIASDPLTYLTLGGTGAEKALAQEAATAAERGNLNRTMSDTLNSALTSMKSRANPITRPVSNTMDYLGSKMYRSGLAPLDQEATAMGKGMISPRLMNEGATGGWQAISQHMLDQSEKELQPKALGLAKKMDDMEGIVPHSEISSRFNPDVSPEEQFQHIDGYGKVPVGEPEHQSFYPPNDPYSDPIDVAVSQVKGTPEPGKTVLGSPLETETVPGMTRTGWVDLDKAMGPGRASNAKLLVEDRAEADPLMKNVFDSTDNLMKQYGDLGSVSREQAVKMKSRLYNTIPDSDWESAVRTPEGAANRMAIAHGLNEGVKSGSTPEIQALGDQLGKVNEQWGQNLTVKDLAQNLANKEINRPAISQVDAMLAGGALGGEHGPMGGALGIKKALQIMRSPSFKTNAGWGLNKLSDIAGPGLDAALRQKLLDDTNRAQSPWALINPAQVGGK